jgi:hypothetical protein
MTVVAGTIGITAQFDNEYSVSRNMPASDDMERGLTKNSSSYNLLLIATRCYCCYQCATIRSIGQLNVDI